MWAIRLRRALWQANAVLAVACALVVTLRATAREPDRTVGPLPDVAAVAAVARRPEAPWPSFSLDELLRDIYRFHGYPRPEAKPAAIVLPDPHAPLPLALFRPAALWFTGEKASYVGLVSKDPARPDHLDLAPDAPCHGVALESVVADGTAAYLIGVRRGEERFTYHFRQNSLREPLFRRSSDSASTEEWAAPVASTTRMDARAEVGSVKCVPFFSAAGNPMGFRVTGVLPGSRAEQAGLRPGDVIVESDGAHVESPVVWAKAWKDGLAPHRLAVERPDPADANRTASVSLALPE